MSLSPVARSLRSRRLATRTVGFISSLQHTFIHSLITSQRLILSFCNCFLARTSFSALTLVCCVADGMLVAPLLTSLSCCLIFAFSLARFLWNSSSTLKIDRYQCFYNFDILDFTFSSFPIIVPVTDVCSRKGTTLKSKPYRLMASSSVLLCCSFKSASLESFSANRRLSSCRTVDWNVNRLPRPLFDTTRCKKIFT